MRSALISVVIASLAGRPHRVGDARETVACSEAFEAARDSSREARPLEHHRRIDLHQAGPGADAVPRLFGGGDAAEADPQHPPAARGAEIAQAVQRVSGQDRKSGVEGTSGEGRGDYGGSRVIKTN